MNEDQHRERILDLDRQCRHLREERDALTLDIRAADEALHYAKVALWEARRAAERAELRVAAE